MTSIGSILSGAFGQLRHRPLIVMIWGIAYMAALFAISYAMMPMYQAQMQGMAVGGSDPQQAAAEMYAMVGRGFLLQFVVLLIVMLLFNASMRAVLRPEDEGFAYLKVGMDELHVFILGVIGVGLFFVFYIAMVIVMALAFTLSFAVAGPVGGIALGGLGLLAVLAVLIWFQVRYSLAFPLTLLRRKLVIAEAWQLSRGHFWTLFGAYLLIGVIIMAATIAVAFLTMGPYLAALAGGIDPQSLQSAAEAQMAQQAAGFTTMTIVGLVLNGIIGGIWIALSGGAVATAARDLATDGQAVAREFA